MTNEQLVLRIQQGDGDNKELMAELWEKTYRLLYMLCSKIYQHYEQRLKQHGVEKADLQQQAYFALLDAVKAFKPEKGFLFSSYLKYHLKRAVDNLLCSWRRESDPLNRVATKRLGEPVTETDNDTELGEIIPDPFSTAPFEEIEQRDVARVVHEAVNELPELQRNVIQLYYFENKTYETVTSELKINRDRARLAEEKALRNLRKSELLEDLRTVTYRGRSAAVCQRLGSTVEQDAERRERLRELIRRRDEKENRASDQDALRHKRLREILGRDIGNDVGTT